jgi:pimeloyl-ACP methyl ester carboxylesterase
MSLRRLSLVIVLSGAIALAVYWFVFREPLPDARLACHYGAYDLDDGRILTIAPSSGSQSLRFVFMDGDTGRLLPEKDSTEPVPRRFSAGPGWMGETPIRARVTFGACDANTLSIALDSKPAVAGKKRTFDVKDVQFESHGLNLAGRLVMPKADGKTPVAVLIHGAERDSGILFNRLQYLLPANRIGVFVYDKRGTGRSEGRYTQDFQLLSDDAAAALNKARELAGTKASEVGFQGGSQAGWIIPLAAGKANADFAVVGFGLAESPLGEDREEVFDGLRTAGFGEDDIAKAREITDATGRVMASRFTRGFDELDKVRAKYRDEPWYPTIKGEFSGMFLRAPNWAIRIFGPWYDVGTSWTHDPAPALNAYQAPQLWILAGRDAQAPSHNTLRILRDLQSTHPKLDVVLFPTADHGITEFELKDGERIDIRFSDGYFPLLVDWILRKDPRVTVTGPIVYRGHARE